ncbi:Uma2 family endonuclease [Salinibacter altiplanensis]|uniref:Uma2 family endonuclease n=1 Tax=Salinibacter altiplanensis TaxID=1803181 RepID=UPI001E32583E
MPPHKNRHSALQEETQNLLRAHAPEGRQPPEFAIATSEGVKAPNVVWYSSERQHEMQKTGDPTTLAPEVCIEVMSASNDWEEMEHKRALYRTAGAEEVWGGGRGGHGSGLRRGGTGAVRSGPQLPGHALRVCFNLSLGPPGEYFLALLGALRAALTGCKSPLYSAGSTLKALHCTAALASRRFAGAQGAPLQASFRVRFSLRRFLLSRSDPKSKQTPRQTRRVLGTTCFLHHEPGPSVSASSIVSSAGGRRL